MAVTNFFHNLCEVIVFFGYIVRRWQVFSQQMTKAFLEITMQILRERQNNEIKDLLERNAHQRHIGQQETMFDRQMLQLFADVGRLYAISLKQMEHNTTYENWNLSQLLQTSY